MLYKVNIIFCSSAHSYGLRQHERARKLHFTRYGWAILSYPSGHGGGRGGVSLRVSTIQMLILLQFNCNTVSVGVVWVGRVSECGCGLLGVGGVL